MDNPLTFGYRLYIFQGGFEGGRAKPSMLGLSSKIVMIGKSVVAFNWAVMESHVVIRGDFVAFSFRETPHCDRKIKMYSLPYRDPTQVGRSSRLRWSGERGSRNSAIKLGVTYGRCLASVSSEAAANEYLAAVYLKHRPLQKRKLRYRGWHLPSAGKSNILTEVRKYQVGI
jgi:hypothetical protein